MVDKTHKVCNINGFVGYKVTFVRSPGAIDQQTKSDYLLFYGWSCISHWRFIHI